jgi:hypothetical protein
LSTDKSTDKSTDETGARACPAAALLAALEGRWRLARAIVDRRRGTAGRLSGEAVFAADGAGLVCVEAGILRLAGAAPLRAERRSLWRAEAGLVAVRFADGRPFHAFDPRAARPGARHDCPPDLYRVAYDFSAWPDWSATWEVTGPRKEYRLRSRYARAAAACAGGAVAATRR